MICDMIAVRMRSTYDGSFMILRNVWFRNKKGTQSFFLENNASNLSSDASYIWESRVHGSDHSLLDHAAEVH